MVYWSEALAGGKLRLFELLKWDKHGDKRQCFYNQFITLIFKFLPDVFSNTPA